MSKTCINHPDRKTYKSYPWCHSILCKECYEDMDKQYQQLYQTANSYWDSVEMDKK